ncbi:MAG: lytic transglycosylase domain-containing protein, partial [Calditrichaeota bacterium]|nr:lytic transglycosylase domain-containing protein [Calditrichota bacterium]
MINKVFLTLIIFSLIPSVLLGPLNAQIQWDYPSSLRPDVEFWKSVFTVYSENQSILHDSENLNIIYKVITFDSSFNTYQRENYLEKIKDEIKDDLIRLAERIPDPDKRTHFEHYLIELFGPGSLPETFRQAARQIRSQQGMKERFAESLARSIPLLPYIREVFKKNNLPEELAYLPHIESSFNPLAKSRAGAAGMWQFMRSTARLYMKVNRIIDERYDPLISTQAAARLLKYNYEQLGEWG